MPCVSDIFQRHAEHCRNLPVHATLTGVTRSDYTAGIVLGIILAVGGFLLGNVIQIGGVTFAAFNFGILIGGVLVVTGLVGLIRR